MYQEILIEILVLLLITKVYNGVHRGFVVEYNQTVLGEKTDTFLDRLNSITKHKI